MREPYAPALLKRKAARLSVERGNLLLVAKGDSGLTPMALFAPFIVRQRMMQAPTLYRRPSEMV